MPLGYPVENPTVRKTLTVATSHPLSRRVIAVLVICWIGIAGASAIGQSSSIDDQIAAHFRAAQDAFRRNQLELAVEEYKQVLRLDPSLIEARANLGLTYHSLGDYQLAISEFERAISQKPALLVANLFLGIDYLKLRRFEKAVPPLKRLCASSLPTRRPVEPWPRAFCK